MMVKTADIMIMRKCTIFNADDKCTKCNVF